jgi:hypothetical protein
LKEDVRVKVNYNVINGNVEVVPVPVEAHGKNHIVTEAQRECEINNGRGETPRELALECGKHGQRNSIIPCSDTILSW